jgi:hypothetical protein
MISQALKRKIDKYLFPGKFLTVSSSLKRSGDQWENSLKALLDQRLTSHSMPLRS